MKIFFFWHFLYLLYIIFIHLNVPINFTYISTTIRCIRKHTFSVMFLFALLVLSVIFHASITAVEKLSEKLHYIYEERIMSNGYEQCVTRDVRDTLHIDFHLSHSLFLEHSQRQSNFIEFSHERSHKARC